MKKSKFTEAQITFVLRQADESYPLSKPTEFLLKYGKLHHPEKANAEFPTFQQDSYYDWNFIVSNVTKEG